MDKINKNLIKFECKFCLEEDFKENLFSPCNCSGNLKYVHKECLDRWRLSTINYKNIFNCSICNFEYILDNNSTYLLRFIKILSKIFLNPIYFYLYSYLYYKFINNQYYLRFNIYKLFLINLINYYKFNIFFKNFLYNLIFILIFNILQKLDKLDLLLNNIINYNNKNISIFF